MLSGLEYLELCDEQNVHLLPAVTEQLRIPYGPVSGSSSLLEAISNAGWAIRHQKAEVMLADKPLDVPPGFHDDTLASALTTMINSQHDPGMMDGLLELERGDVNVGTCRAAENYFFDIFRSIGKVSRNGAAHDGWGAQIIMDGRRPVLLRKSYEEQSAITLEPVAVGGIVYPPGSLLALDIDGANEYPDTGRVNIVSAEEIICASFKRLSDFALKPAEREEIRGAFYPRHSESRQKMLAFTMRDARRLTEQALITMRSKGGRFARLLALVS